MAKGFVRALDIRRPGWVACKIAIPGSKVIVVGPFIAKNPEAPAEDQDIMKPGTLPTDAIAVQRREARRC